MASDFAHLHLHTQYSFLDGAIRIEELVKHLPKINMSKVAITDHGNMFGVIDFYQQAIRMGITPIIGMEAYITGKSFCTDRIRENFHLLLLAENEIGFHNLKKLSTYGFFHGKYYFPRIDKRLLFKHREGIIGLSACLSGELARECLNKNIIFAKNIINEYKSILGENNYFLEIQTNELPKQEIVNDLLLELSFTTNSKLAVTNDCHYLFREQHKAHAILSAIRQGKYFKDIINQTGTMDSLYVRTPGEMWNLTKDKYASAFHNTCEIAKRCNVNIKSEYLFLPKIIVPKEMSKADYLCYLARKGLRKKINLMSLIPKTKNYIERLEMELEVINKMKFASYFLIVQDFVNWAKNNDIKTGLGRGSGAGSLVAYALGITGIDPMVYNLLFERFLNIARISLPDMDIDFMQQGRDKVIDYVMSTYGADRVAQVVTYSAMHSKSLIKDIARTMEIPFHEINKLVRPIPILLDGKKPLIREILKHSSAFRTLINANRKYELIINLSRDLEGLYRHAGIHAGGLVIAKEDLVQYVPLFAGPCGEIVIQIDKDNLDYLGLVKFDFLGLKTLDIIHFAEKLINKRIAADNKIYLNKKPFFDGEFLTPDNLLIYDFISSGRTFGIFQMESKGFSDLCKKLKPDCFEDIIAALALYRPGPIQSGMLQHFINRKHDKKSIKYPHPILEPVLKITYGTFIYQEQIMKAAQLIAGYTLSEADILRRAMAKKQHDEIIETKNIFVNKTMKNNIPRYWASKIFDKMTNFSNYCFNKSHSAAYAKVSYQTAYLKYYYPVEFATAILNVAITPREINRFLHYIKSSEIFVNSPDINISQHNFSIRYQENYLINERKKFDFSNCYGHIQFAFDAIKGLGDTAIIDIIDERKKNGLFYSIKDFYLRTLIKVNKKSLEFLIKSGCMDSLGITRKKLFNQFEKFLNKTINFTSIYYKNIEILDDDSEWKVNKLLGNEYEALGVYLSGHPLHTYLKLHNKFNLLYINYFTVDDLEYKLNETIGRKISFVGIIVEIHEKTAKKSKKKWAYLIIHYGADQLRIVCTHKKYLLNYSKIKKHTPFLLTVTSVFDENANENQANDEYKNQLIQMYFQKLNSLQNICTSFYSVIRIIIRHPVKLKHVLRKNIYIFLKQILITCRDYSEKKTCIIYIGIEGIEIHDKIKWIICNNIKGYPTKNFVEQLEKIIIVSSISCE